MLDLICTNWLGCLRPNHHAEVKERHLSDDQPQSDIQHGLLHPENAPGKHPTVHGQLETAEPELQGGRKADLPCPLTPKSAAQSLLLLPDPALPAVILRVERSKLQQHDADPPLDGLHAQVGLHDPRSRLVPAWCNTALIKHYKLSALHDYLRILRRLASKDPLLVHIFEKADESSAGMDAALVVQHGVPFNVTEVVPRVLRDYFTLNLLPTIVTVVTFQGKVLYQNASSLAYYGDFAVPDRPANSPLATSASTRSSSHTLAAKVSIKRSSARNSQTDLVPHFSSDYSLHSQSSAHDSIPAVPGKDAGSVTDDKNLLKQLFNLDPAALEEALDVLSTTSQWSGVVQVPLNMKRHLRSARQNRRLSFAAGAGANTGHDTRASFHKFDLGERPSRPSPDLTMSNHAQLAFGSVAEMPDVSTLFGAPSIPGNAPDWQHISIGSVVPQFTHDAHNGSEHAQHPGNLGYASDGPPGSPQHLEHLGGTSAGGQMQVSSDSYDFDATISNRLQWPWQAGLETVQEAELEMDVDLMVAEPSLLEQDCHSGPLDLPETSTLRSHAAALRALEGPPSSVQSRSGSRTQVDSHTGYFVCGSEGGATAGSVDARGGPPTASGRQSQDVHRMSNVSLNAGLRESISDRSFSLSKSVTAVLDVIERKRTGHHVDPHSNSSLQGSAVAHSPHGRPGSSYLHHASMSGVSGNLLGAEPQFDPSAAAELHGDQRSSWQQNTRRSTSNLSRTGNSNMKLTCVGDSHSEALINTCAGAASCAVPNALMIANSSATSTSQPLNWLGPLGQAGLSGYTASPTEYPPSPFTQEKQSTHATSQKPGQNGCVYGGSGAVSPPCWHEVTAFPMIDPVLDQRVLLITQTDVSKRVDVERKLADLTTAQMSMLEQMFPRHVIEHMLSEPGLLSSDVGRLANDHEMVSVLFADVVGFTNMSKEISASAVMLFLNALYSEFDNILEEYGLYQLDTMGDCYIVVGGLLEPDAQGFQSLQSTRTPEQAAQDAHNIMQFAKAMLARAGQMCMPHNGQPVQLRIGIHSGKLVSGMLGSRLPKFTLFGDTINTASRMESSCLVGCIQVSEATHVLLQQYHHLASSKHPSVAGYEPRNSEIGGTWVSTTQEVKGKGTMNTFLFHPDTCSLHASLSGEYVTQASNVRGGHSTAGHAAMAFSSATMSLAHAMSGQLHEDIWEEQRAGAGGPRAGSLVPRRSFYNSRDGWKALERSMTGKLASTGVPSRGDANCVPSFDGSTRAYGLNSALDATTDLINSLNSIKAAGYAEGPSYNPDSATDIPSGYRASRSSHPHRSSTGLSNCDLTGVLALQAALQDQNNAQGEQVESIAGLTRTIRQQSGVSSSLPTSYQGMTRVRTVPDNMGSVRRDNTGAALNSQDGRPGQASAPAPGSNTPDTSRAYAGEQGFLFNSNPLSDKLPRSSTVLATSNPAKTMKWEEAGTESTSGPFTYALLRHSKQPTPEPTQKLPLVLEDAGSPSRLNGSDGTPSSASVKMNTEESLLSGSAARVPDRASGSRKQPSQLSERLPVASQLVPPTGTSSAARNLGTTTFLMNRFPAAGRCSEEEPTPVPGSLPTTYGMQQSGVHRNAGAGGGDVVRFASPSRSHTSGGYHQTRSRRGSSLLVLGSLGAALNHVAAGGDSLWQDAVKPNQQRPES